MTRKKWWISLLVVLLAAAVGVFAFWDTIAVYIAPKTVLTKALTNTISQLEQRFSLSPLSIIAKSIDPDGRYTAQMELETENEPVGKIAYDMTVRLDMSANQLNADGTASTSGNDLDLSFYMDKDFMAVSSEDFLKGTYYGITYETFSSDIRSIPLLNMLVGEDILSRWDADITRIKDQMNRSYKLPDFSEVSREDMRILLTAILLLPSDVEQVEMRVGEESVKCHRITYSADGEQVREVLGYLIDTGDSSDASVSASFYLFDNEVILMQLQGQAGENSIRYALELMPNASNSIVLRVNRSENGEDRGFCMRHGVEQSGSYINESWTHYANFEATSEATQFNYRWEPVMGEMVISQDTPVTLHLVETDNGFRLATNEFHRLINMLSGQEADSEGVPAACTMSVTKGAGISTPEYKNLNTWSLQDLMSLLGGIGSLFGLQVG